MRKYQPLVGRFKKDQNAQTAIADAVLTLIILTVASAILYSAISGAVISSSEARQRDDLRSTALEVGVMPLETSVPSVSFINLTSGRTHNLTNVTGSEILSTIFELEVHTFRTGDKYEKTGLERAVKGLYEQSLSSRSFAVHSQCNVEGTVFNLFFTFDGGTQSSVQEVPHPRIVTHNVLHQSDFDVDIDLYIWK